MGIRTSSLKWLGCTRVCPQAVKDMRGEQIAKRGTGNYCDNLELMWHEGQGKPMWLERQVRQRLACHQPRMTLKTWVRFRRLGEKKDCKDQRSENRPHTHTGERVKVGAGPVRRP